MAGLLDALNSDDARLGLSLLAAAGPQMAPLSFGQRLAGALGSFDEYKKDQTRSKMYGQQFEVGKLALEKAKREAANEEGLQSLMSQFFAPGAPAMGQLDSSLPPEMQTGIVPTPARPPRFDVEGFAATALSKGYMNPLTAIQLQQAAAKDSSPITVAPGASLVDRRTLKPVYTAPKEQSLPAAIQEYQFAVSQGYQGSFNEWDKERKKAGANSVSLSVNTERSLLNDIAGGLSKSIVGARDNAQAALGTISTVNRLQDALDTGKVMAGPSSNFRQFGLQLGEVLGVSGKDANERLTNTRQAIQSLAQLELDAAQQMKGQGQITEAERDIIRRAAAGDIEKMTVPELRTLANTLDKTARAKIRGFNQQAQPLVKNPNAAPLAPFLTIEEPAPRKAPNVMRFDANGNPVRE